jgi:serine/threonine protein kinase
VNATLLDLASKIGKAKTAQDVVGPDDGGRGQRVKKIRLVLHPDKWSKLSDQEAATIAFARLEDLLNKEARRVSSKFEITTKARTYTIDGLEFTGHIANLYNCTYVRDGAVKSGLVKMTRNPVDNDLLEQEAKVLRAVFKEEHKRQAFYPRLEDTFVHRDTASNIDRRTNVLRRFDDFISLEQVQALFGEEHRFDARDLAWMWRRAYAGISLAHELGYVHGSLSPAHILIHPELHGLQIVGWGQSVEIGDTVKLLGDDRRIYFAPEVLNKEPATPATDLYAISRVFMFLLERDITEPGVRQFRAFIKGTTYNSMAARPQNARELLGEFDELLERTFGPRKFREFVLPST